MVDPITMGNLIAGASFATAAASGTLSASTLPYNVAMTMTVRNRTQYRLKLNGFFEVSGKIKNAIQYIDPGYMETMAAHKVGDTATGTAGTIAWNVEGLDDQLVVVMWSVPYSHDFYSNWLAVGVRKGGYDESNFNTMYSGENQDFFRRKEYNREGGCVESVGAGDCTGIKVSGTMGTSHKCDITIDILPTNTREVRRQN